MPDRHAFDAIGARVKGLARVRRTRRTGLQHARRICFVSGSGGGVLSQ